MGAYQIVGLMQVVGGDAKPRGYPVRRPRQPVSALWRQFDLHPIYSILVTGTSAPEVARSLFGTALISNSSIPPFTTSS